jgi:hypothetical protein
MANICWTVYEPVKTHTRIQALILVGFQISLTISGEKTEWKGMKEVLHVFAKM